MKRLKFSKRKSSTLTDKDMDLLKANRVVFHVSQWILIHSFYIYISMLCGLQLTILTGRWRWDQEVQTRCQFIKEHSVAETMEEFPFLREHCQVRTGMIPMLILKRFKGICKGLILNLLHRCDNEGCSSNKSNICWCRWRRNSILWMAWNWKKR